jgi:hypothetical protein
LATADMDDDAVEIEQPTDAVSGSVVSVGDDDPQG